MGIWDWFETLSYGHPLRKREKGERLRLLMVSAVVGLMLGLVLYSSGVSQSFLDIGLRQVVFRTIPAGSIAAPAAGTPIGAAAAPANSAPLQGGGWLTPVAP